MISLRIEGPMATIVMSRPPVNAIDSGFVAAFDAAIDDVEAASPALVVVRSGQRVFSAGADLGLIRSFFDLSDGAARMVAYVSSLHRLFDRIEALPSVSLACIDGAALGGGFELALACDLRLASDAARLGLPEVGVGMIPGAGGTQRLPRLAGPGVARRLILGADVVGGVEAQRLGLVQWVTEAQGFEAQMARVSERICGSSKEALVEAKACLQAFHDPAVDGYERELEAPLRLMASEESRRRIAAFFERRSA